MELIIKKDCVECPFFTDTFNTCELKAKKEGRLNYTDESDRVPYVDYVGHPIPDWCPLRQESVSIGLENGKNEISAEYEYEMFFDSEQIHGWYPISTDRIRHPEKTDHYIETGLLRKIKR